MYCLTYIVYFCWYHSVVLSTRAVTSAFFMNFVLTLLPKECWFINDYYSLYHFELLFYCMWTILLGFYYVLFEDTAVLGHPNTPSWGIRPPCLLVEISFFTHAYILLIFNTFNLFVMSIVACICVYICVCVCVFCEDLCVCVCVCVCVYIRHSQVRVHTSPLQLWLGKVNYRIVNHITRSPVNKTAFSSCFSLHFGNLIKSVFRLTNYFLTIWILTAIRSLLYTIHLHPLPTPDWWLPPGWYTLLHRLWGDCVIYSCDRLVGVYSWSLYHEWVSTY